MSFFVIVSFRGIRSISALPRGGPFPMLRNLAKCLRPPLSEPRIILSCLVANVSRDCTNGVNGLRRDRLLASLPASFLHGSAGPPRAPQTLTASKLEGASIRMRVSSWRSLLGGELSGPPTGAFCHFVMPTVGARVYLSSPLDPTAFSSSTPQPVLLSPNSGSGTCAVYSEGENMLRVLLTTRCRDTGLYDYFRENAPRNFRWRFAMPRKISFGLRFLKQNLPGLTILEYPTRTEYSKLLKRGWDAVGYSFYLEETNDILSMAHEARRAGVPQLWAGNYGALTPSIHSHFDHIFSSYSEHE